MTHKKLNFSEQDKDFIEDSIIRKTMSVTELANHFGCHPKTINRVMTERGIGAISTKAKSNVAGENLRIRKLLGQAGIGVDQLSQLVMLLMAAKLTDPDELKVALASALNSAKNTFHREKTAALFRQPDVNVKSQGIHAAAAE